MATFFITFLVFGAAIAAMTVGVVFTGKTIKGSCGGINTIDGDSCSVCGLPAGDTCDGPDDLQKKLNGGQQAKSAF